MAQEVEGEMVLFNVETGAYFVLDDVGSRCWQLLSEHGNVDEVVGLLMAEFDVDEQTLRSDLANLVSSLSEAGLVSVPEPGT